MKISRFIIPLLVSFWLILFPQEPSSKDTLVSIIKMEDSADQLHLKYDSIMDSVRLYNKNFDTSVTKYRKRKKRKFLIF